MMYFPLSSHVFLENIKSTQSDTGAVSNQKLYFESFAIDSQPLPTQLGEQFKVKLIFLSGEVYCNLGQCGYSCLK